MCLGLCMCPCVSMCVCTRGLCVCLFMCVCLLVWGLFFTSSFQSAFRCPFVFVSACIVVWVCGVLWDFSWCVHGFMGCVGVRRAGVLLAFESVFFVRLPFGSCACLSLGARMLWLGWGRSWLWLLHLHSVVVPLSYLSSVSCAIIATLKFDMVKPERIGTCSSYIALQCLASVSALQFFINHCGC